MLTPEAVGRLSEKPEEKRDLLTFCEMGWKNLGVHLAFSCPGGLNSPMGKMGIGAAAPRVEGRAV